MTDTRIRLNLISEVAFEGNTPRPIHMFRPGTFVDMSGRETSFTQDDVAVIASRVSKRRKLPITERHDFGQAIGRLQDVWSDADGNLFGLPKWNAKGRTLLEDEIYDGFSCELDKDDAGWCLIGGSLTNYPAVGDLEPVTLSAPPLRPIEIVPLPSAVEGITPIPFLDTAPTAPVPARPHTQPTTQEQPTMPEEIVELVTPTLPPITDPALQSRLDAILAQQQAAMAQRERDIEARVRAEFDRRMLESEQRTHIYAFAHARTMTTAEQPYAVPSRADELAQLLLETPSAVRGKWMTLLTQITTSGLVSFDEIGSSGGGSEDTDRWSILVNAKVSAGLSRVEAIRAVGKEHPDLYAAQQYQKGGR